MRLVGNMHMVKVVTNHYGHLPPLSLLPSVRRVQKSVTAFTYLG